MPCLHSQIYKIPERGFVLFYRLYNTTVNILYPASYGLVCSLRTLIVDLLLIISANLLDSGHCHRPRTSAPSS